MALQAEAGLGICRRGFFACVDGQFVEDPNRSMVLPSDEICDGLDNDCNGRVDEEGSLGCVNRYPDQDGDGYGTNLAMRCLCESTNRWTPIRATVTIMTQMNFSLGMFMSTRMVMDLGSGRPRMSRQWSSPGWLCDASWR